LLKIAKNTQIYSLVEFGVNNNILNLYKIWSFIQSEIAKTNPFLAPKKMANFRPTGKFPPDFPGFPMGWARFLESILPP